MGPKSYTGPIGAQLSKCEELPVVNFEQIQCEIPHIDRKSLSKDQQYLLDINSVIKSGSCPNDFAVDEPGLLSYS